MRQCGNFVPTNSHSSSYHVCHSSLSVNSWTTSTVTITPTTMTTRIMITSTNDNRGSKVRDVDDDGNGSTFSSSSYPPTALPLPLPALFQAALSDLGAETTLRLTVLLAKRVKLSLVFIQLRLYQTHAMLECLQLIASLASLSQLLEGSKATHMEKLNLHIGESSLWTLAWVFWPWAIDGCSCHACHIRKGRPNAHVLRVYVSAQPVINVQRV